MPSFIYVYILFTIGVAATAAKVLHVCTGSPTAALTKECESTCSACKPCWWITAAVVAALAVGAYTVCKHHK